MVDDRDLVAHFLGLFEVMSRQNDRHPPFAVQLAHVFPEHLAKFDVHACGGFIQNKDMGVMNQRLTQQKPAAHTAGQGAGVGVGLIL